MSRRVDFSNNNSVAETHGDSESRRSGTATQGRNEEHVMSQLDRKFGQTGNDAILRLKGPPPSGPEVTNTLFNSGRWGGRRKTKRNQKAKKSRKTRRVRRSRKSKKSHRKTK
jgi:hypothetical protein